MSTSSPEFPIVVGNFLEHYDVYQGTHHTNVPSVWFKKQCRLGKQSYSSMIEHCTVQTTMVMNIHRRFVVPVEHKFFQRIAKDWGIIFCYKMLVLIQYNALYNSTFVFVN